MGLEMVDIVIGTEDAFGISIADEDMFDIRTVGQYYDYLLGKVQTGDYDKCLSSVLFYRLRRAFADCLGIERSRFKPDTTLDSLLPQKGRRSAWSELARSADLEFPSLGRPGWVFSLGLAGVVASIAAAVVLRSWLPVAGVMALPVLIYYLTTPLAVYLPHDTMTVRSAVSQMLVRNASKLVGEKQEWSPDHVWQVMVAVIVDRLKVDPREVTREAKFVDDLGVG